MDIQLRTWTEKQDATLAEMAQALDRQANQIALMARELVGIAIVLAPKAGDGPSPLEEMLAQLVAHGRQTNTTLRGLIEQGNRIEAKLDSEHTAYSGANGAAKALA